jgi:Ca2+-binding EF-hand superfamily protein
MEKVILTFYKLYGQDDRKGDNDPKQRVEAIFRKMDKNYSNTLDEQEFIEGCFSDPILMRLLTV